MALENEPSKTPVGGPNVFTNRGPRLTGLPPREDDSEHKDDTLDDSEQDDELDPQEEINDIDEDIPQSSNKMKNMQNGASKAKTLANLLKKNPKLKIYVCIAAAAFFAIFIIIMLFMAMGGAGEEEENKNNDDYTTDVQKMSYYYDPTYDFTRTIVTLKNPISGEDFDTPITYEDLVKNVVYGLLVYGNSYEKAKQLSDEKKLILFEASLILVRSDPLRIGNYNYETKEITLNSGSDGVASCDVYYGCKIIKKNNKIAFLPANDSTKNITENVIKTVEPMDEKTLAILDKAYSNTKYLFLAKHDTNELIKTFDYDIPYSEATLAEWIDTINGESLQGTNYYDSYGKLIYNTTIFDKYKIYNLTDYIEKYDLVGDAAWWWPIGSVSKDNDGLYSGTPVSSSLVQDYGKTTTDTGSVKSHDGIDIQSECGSNVIVSRAGVIKEVGYDKIKGNYVVIDHKDENKTISYYYHLKEDSIVVKEGNSVRRGQLIGKVGNTEAEPNCHLHFSIYANGSAVNPNNHVSLDRARATSVDVFLKYVDGIDNKQSICLSLKQSGFSNNATAALLANIYHESSYIPNNKGDWSGNIHTSYGLCQWHNSRKTRLLNHCRENYGNDAAIELGSKDPISSEMQKLQLRCQLDYLIYELKTHYVNRYQVLLSNETAHKMGWDFCYNFEVPASRETKCVKRGDYATNLLNNYVKPQTSNGTKGCGID